MRTEGECLAKAVEMERFALHCQSWAARREFLLMARGWRGVASQAAWQDRFAV